MSGSISENGRFHLPPLRIFYLDLGGKIGEKQQESLGRISNSARDADSHASSEYLSPELGSWKKMIQTVPPIELLSQVQPGKNPRFFSLATLDAVRSQTPKCLAGKEKEFAKKASECIERLTEEDESSPIDHIYAAEDTLQALELLIDNKACLEVITQSVRSPVSQVQSRAERILRNRESR
jgi:hypothetical protein